MDEYRKFLRFYDQEEYEKVVPVSDQQKKKPHPSYQKDYPEDGKLIDLIPPEELKIGYMPFLDALNRRKSRRRFTDEPLSLEELSFLLWCTQGVKRVLKSGSGVMRIVASAGAKSPLETYLVINRVVGLESGLYRYISFSHKLCFLKSIDEAEKRMGELAYNQMFVGKAPVIFYWVAVPYRTEWRYTILSPKFIAIDLGLVCQNLYMACEAIKLGTVAIGYYEQNKLDELFDLDGKEEFVVLLAPVGKYPEGVKLRDFFEHPKAEVKPEMLSKYVGKYKRENIYELVMKDNMLCIKVGDYFEPYDPHNETEFLGEFVFRAARFILDSEGRPVKMIILTLEDEIKEFSYIGSE
ncbi:MAG: SagB/ThcOx family dehydrogenase [Candidatus Hodarchaeota archaeon]